MTANAPWKQAMKALVLLLLLCFLPACSLHPLGMSDDEWNRLTPEQKLEARKEAERNRLERARLYQEEQERRERERRERERQERLQAQWHAGEDMIFHYRPRHPYCMGGARCPKGSLDELVLPLRKKSYVDHILFHATDRLGNKHKGKVTVYADGMKVARKIAIKRDGSWHLVRVERKARTIILRAVGDDEVEILEVKVIGKKKKHSKPYYYSQ